jgi:hypothetical protein
MCPNSHNGAQSFQAAAGCDHGAASWALNNVIHRMPDEPSGDLCRLINDRGISGASVTKPTPPSDHTPLGRRCAFPKFKGAGCPSRIGPGLRSKRILNHMRLISSNMGTRPGDAEKARRALQRRHPLLAAWLDALDRFDNPMRRRAAHFREHSCVRRDVEAIRGPRIRNLSSNLAGPARGRPHV